MSEGIFRVPGGAGAMASVVDAFETGTNKEEERRNSFLIFLGKGAKVDFAKGNPPDVFAPDVASVLKKFLRDLPEPLFTTQKSDEIKGVMQIADENARTEKFQVRLPLPNFLSLFFLRLLPFLTPKKKILTF
jgi:hypothetical protein